MKNTSFLILFLLITLLPALTRGEEEFNWKNIKEDGCLHASYTIETYYEYVYGNTNKLESAIDFNRKTHDNWHYRELLTLGARKYILSDNSVIDFYIEGEHTTDKIEQFRTGKLWGFENLFLRLSVDKIGKSNFNEVPRFKNLPEYKYEASAGSIVLKFSDYTISGNTFGISASWRPVCAFNVIVAGGVSNYLNEELYTNPYGAARIIFTPIPNTMFGATFIHSEMSWIDPKSSSTNYSNDVWSLDAYMEFLDNKLIIDAETAISRYNADRNDPTSDTVNGWALKLNVAYKSPGCLNWNFKYEHQEPDFTSKFYIPTQTDIYSWEELETDLIRGDINYTAPKMWDLYGRCLYRRIFVDDGFNDYRNLYEAEIRVTYGPTVPTIVFPIKGATLIFSLLYGRDRSKDEPQSFNEERLEVSIKGEKSKYGLGYTYKNVKSYIDSKPDCISHSVSLDLPETYLPKKNSRYLRCFELRLRGKFAVAYEDRYTRDPEHRVNGVSVSIHPALTLKYIPLGTELTVDYDAAYPFYGEESDQFKNTTKVALTQPIKIKDRYESKIVLSYEGKDYWSRDPDNSYGSGIFKLAFEIVF